MNEKKKKWILLKSDFRVTQDKLIDYSVVKTFN